jgi:uncharacterized membrane protein YkvA (DUF1232 family)
MNINIERDHEDVIFLENITGDQQIKLFQRKAQEYIGNSVKTRDLLSKAIRKAENNKQSEALRTIWNQIHLLFSLVRDWTNGAYRNISKSSIAAVVAGLLYFVSPVDFVPDWVIGLGLIDDATVLGLIINQLNKEIKRYKEWKQ